ncbi:tRNA (adenosine(37)-N6)-dimethylallyltransferase MiaA [Candidatus Kaiserbacteria bacterium]|nr:tRNA (adenosine(37)-N6)-dimethylallyltransferase MiaA [Candidatus Kaiserbacteria bacterium]
MGEKQKVIVVVGPTASGKSALAVELAQRFNGEVISADSRQVYKGLDIGSGKITKREMKGIPHHLLDVANPKKTFTAHDFKIHATRTAVQIVCRDKLPIICGGTGFYIDVLLGRINLPDVPADRRLRARLEKKSVTELFVMLKKLDPARAKKIDSVNKVRLVRAIEIAKALPHIKPNVSLRTPKFDVLWIGLRPDKNTMRKKINARLLARIRQGMMHEAQKLHAGGLSWKRMESLGLEYRYLALHLQKKLSKDEMLKQLETKIWQYAKRQLTYWKRNKDIHWFDPRDTNTIVREVEKFLYYFE